MKVIKVIIEKDGKTLESWISDDIRNEDIPALGYYFRDILREQLVIK